MERSARRLGRPKSFNTSDSKTTIRALDRAIDVLEALANSDGLILSDLSRQLEQSPATLYRALSTLEERELVETDPQTQAWHIGPMAYKLGAAFLRRSSVIERSRPIMRELMLATGETSNLGIERQGEVMFVSQVETHESIRAFFPPGTLSPMHASGIGKALLSCYSADRLTAYAQRTKLRKFTFKTISTAEELREEMSLIRARGWAFDDEEKTEGMRCIAAPIRNMYGEAVAGISVSGPTNRLSDTKVARVSEEVTQAAKRIEHDIGFSG